MLKTIDKFVLKRFFGPFLLTFSVVLFILLLVNVLKYFKDFVGKDLGIDVFFEFFFYFALVTTPIALPLAVLLASLMSFGGLGQHSELTAIKGAGISLVRILIPVGIFVVFITVAAVYFNETISPTANLKAYSLLYDIREKKPTLGFNPGEFYNGLPGYSIKIEDKTGENEEVLHKLMIYDHSAQKGNVDLIMADSGRMFTMGKNDDFLVLELFHGSTYSELSAKKGRRQDPEYTRSDFDSSKIVFSMASFGLKKTKEELFKGHNMMKTTSQLRQERDSLIETTANLVTDMPRRVKGYHQYQFHADNEAYKEEARKEQAERMEALKKGNPEVKNTPSDNIPDTSRSTTGNYSSHKEKPGEILPEKPKIELSNPQNKSVIDAFLAKKRNKNKVEAEKKKQALQAKASFAKQKLNARRNKPTKREKQRKEDSILINDSLQSTGATDKDLVVTENSRKKNIEDVKQERRRQEKRVNIKTVDKPKVDESIEKKEKELGFLEQPSSYRALNMAWSKTNGIKGAVEDIIRRQERDEKRVADYQIDIYMKLAQAIAVFVMFLIGAPLGAIIKKGGLGVPVLISIVFFVIYYISTMMGKKYAEEMVISPIVGCWSGILLLFLVGLFCLRQAYADARLFDFDYYVVQINKLKDKIVGQKTV